MSGSGKEKSTGSSAQDGKNIARAPTTDPLLSGPGQRPFPDAGPGSGALGSLINPSAGSRQRPFPDAGPGSGGFGSLIDPSAGPRQRPFPDAGPGSGGGFGSLINPSFGDLGRSDLDPFGRFGAGMIADPRGFRHPREMPMPGIPGIPPPPGARFDPIGPPMPSRPNTGLGSFAYPNPDEPPPPGFNDMFM